MRKTSLIIISLLLTLLLIPTVNNAASTNLNSPLVDINQGGLIDNSETDISAPTVNNASSSDPNSPLVVDSNQGDPIENSDNIEPAHKEFILEHDPIDNNSYRLIDPRINEVVSRDYSASTLLQYAINALTPDRTWIETIILRGNISDLGNVTYGSYVRFVGENATLTIAKNATTIFERESSISDLVNVAFENLELNGCSMLSGTGINAYKIVNGTHVGINNLQIYNCTLNNFSMGLQIFTISSEIARNNFSLCMQSISLANDHNSKIKSNCFYVGDQNGKVSSYGMQVIDADGVEITNNTFIGVPCCDTIGIICDAQFRCSSISDNIFTNLSRVAIAFGAVQRPEEYLIEYNLVNNNTISNMPSGIAFEVGYAYPVNGLLISHNTIVECMLILRAGFAGINVPNDFEFSENMISGDLNRFELYGNATNALITDNHQISPMLYY